MAAKHRKARPEILKFVKARDVASLVRNHTWQAGETANIRSACLEWLLASRVRNPWVPETKDTNRDAGSIPAALTNFTNQKTMSKNITISLPPQLRQFNENKDSVEFNSEGDKTLRELLDSLHVEIRVRIFQDGGKELRRTLLVFINDNDIRDFQGLDTKLNAGDRIALLAAAAGG